MTKSIYLLTGFLGSGKTTALRELTRYFPNKKIVYIINEFSKNSVDANLVNDLQGKIEEINYGLISCVCKLPLLEKLLTELEKTDVDVIFIEASGLADPEQVEKTILHLSSSMRNPYDYKGSICIVDAARFLKTSETNRRVLEQLALADLVVLNKVDLASAEQIAEIEKRISAMKIDTRLIKTTFSKLPFIDLTDLNQFLARHKGDFDLSDNIGENPDFDLKRMIFQIDPQATIHQIRYFIQLIADETYRIKGFCYLNHTENPFLINCVGPFIQIEEYQKTLLHQENLNMLYVIFDTHFKTEEVVTKALQTIEPDFFKILEVV